MSTAAAFKTEATLVESFVSSLSVATEIFQTVGPLQITQEWRHRSALVDVLVRDAQNNLIAVEAKLRDWRRALFQAYRSTAYANWSYVLLPHTQAVHALQFRDEFESRGIGLCAMEGQGFTVLIEAQEQEPLLGWLRCAAHAFFDELLNDGVEPVGGSQPLLC